jgi:hypothetical protein
MKNSVNLNHTVTVILTQEGAMAHSRYEKKFLPSKYHKNLVTGSTIELPLWELMQIFGPYTNQGFGPLFKDNQIELP